MTNATDPTDSQSIERTPDPSESKLSTTQTTKLEKTRKLDYIQAMIWARINDEAEKEGIKFTLGQSYGLGSVIKEVLHPQVTALIQAEASRIALEAIGKDDAPDVRIEEINGIEGEYDWSSPCNQLRAEQRTKLKALTAPEGGNDHE